MDISCVSEALHWWIVLFILTYFIGRFPYAYVGIFQNKVLFCVFGTESFVFSYLFTHFSKMLCFVYFGTFYWKFSLCISRQISIHDRFLCIMTHFSIRLCFFLYGTFSLRVWIVYFDRFSARFCFVCYLGTFHWKFSLCIFRQISIEDRGLCIWHI
jgi:hypothetical protein